MRVVNFTLFGVMAGLLMLIYQQKHETRELEARAAELSREISEQTRALAVLRAEWTYLTRPERLEKIARERMGLEPVKPEQIKSFVAIAGPQGKGERP
ncbi:cell division protein FtsL [Dichotomicrobium thermohalophilum]|uniref:Cell division protein FtsL n=1 Tax=Dichotomicrobium thermohalophilum TaxID=933063 RepID=A0A397PFF6_9HYPH|nr:cell division protein FtsL [Dichotomicrobium thermohalophilum]RIA47752.1 cell division protein FtsL [Dichotomicrobium thermohalophilum]